MPLAKERCLHLFCLTSSIFYRFLKLNQKCAFYLDAMLSKLFLLFMWSCSHSCVEVCEVSVKHSYVLRSLETFVRETLGRHVPPLLFIFLLRDPSHLSSPSPLPGDQRIHLKEAPHSSLTEPSQQRTHPSLLFRKRKSGRRETCLRVPLFRNGDYYTMKMEKEKMQMDTFLYFLRGASLAL